MTTPPVTSGLVLNLDADDLDLDDNDPVAAWGVASQSDAGLRPTFHTDVLAGMGVVRFDGDQQLDHPAVLTDDHTCFYVLRPTASGSQAIFYYHTGDMPSGDLGLFAEGDLWDEGWGSFSAGANQRTSDVYPTPQEWAIHVHQPGGLFRDGTEVSYGTANTVEAGGLSTLGARADISGLNFVGDIAQVVVYDRVLSSGEREQVEAWLEAKWFPPPAPPPEGDLYNEGAGEDDWVAGNSPGSGSQSKEADHLALSLGGFGSQRTWVTDELVDLTDVGEIEIDWSGANGSYYLVASTNKAASFTTYDARFQDGTGVSFTRRIDTLDVSALSGDFYVRAHLSNLAATPTLRIYRVTLIGGNEPPTIFPVTADGHTFTATPRPTLAMTATDPDGDPLDVEVVVQTSAGAGVWSGDAVDQGGGGWTAEVGVDLTSGTTYRWRARAYDGQAYSDWTAWRTFTVTLAHVRQASGHVAPGGGQGTRANARHVTAAGHLAPLGGTATRALHTTRHPAGHLDSLAGTGGRVHAAHRHPAGHVGPIDGAAVVDNTPRRHGRGHVRPIGGTASRTVAAHRTATGPLTIDGHANRTVAAHRQAIGHTAPAGGHATRAVALPRAAAGHLTTLNGTAARVATYHRAPTGHLGPIVGHALRDFIQIILGPTRTRYRPTTTHVDYQPTDTTARYQSTTTRTEYR